MRSRKKTLLITLISVACVLAAGAALFFILRSNRDPVKVYSAADFSSSDDGSNQNSSYGSVRADNLQTVYLSDTQQVLQIFVNQGDTVKKGDKLLSFDSTLSDMQLNRKQLEIQQDEQNLKRLKLQYNDLVGSNYYKVDTNSSTTLSAPSTLLPLTLLANHLHRNPDSTEPVQPTESTVPTEPEPSEPVNPLPSSFPYGELTADGLVQDYYYINVGTGKKDTPYLFAVSADASFLDNSFMEALLGDREGPVYAVFAQTYGALPNSKVTQAWGVCFTRDTELEGSPVRLSFFNATGRVGKAIDDPNASNEPEPTPEPTPEPSTPSTPEVDPVDPDPSYNPSPIDPDPGPSRDELDRQKRELQTNIRDTDLKIRTAKVELEQMKKELGDGNVYATIDGVVSFVGDAISAAQNHEPLIKISGGGGYYIDGYVSELNLNSVYEGQTVYVTDWDSGSSLEGSVAKISTVPAENGYVDGNPNATCYTYSVFVPENENLQEGHFVEMRLDTSATDTGTNFYLDYAFLSQENGKFYVYLQDENGRLKKQEVTTGRDLWNSYLEILSGCDQDSYLAFPYSANLEIGAKTVVTESSELYGY